MKISESVTARTTIVAGTLWMLTFTYLGLVHDVSAHTLADVSLLAMAVLVTIFTGLYGFRSRWASNHIGQLFLVKSTLLSLVLLQGAIAAWSSTEYPGRDYIRLIIYIFGALAFVGMLVSLWREQTRDRRREAGQP